MAAGSEVLPRGSSTICLPISKDDYLAVIDSAQRFRAWLDCAFRDSPELFPEAFAHGYSLKDDRTSKVAVHQVSKRVRAVRPSPCRA